MSVTNAAGERVTAGKLFASHTRHGKCCGRGSRPIYLCTICIRECCGSCSKWRDDARRVCVNCQRTS